MVRPHVSCPTACGTTDGHAAANARMYIRFERLKPLVSGELGAEIFGVNPGAANLARDRGLLPCRDFDETGRDRCRRRRDRVRGELGGFGFPSMIRRLSHHVPVPCPAVRVGLVKPGAQRRRVGALNACETADRRAECGPRPRDARACGPAHAAGTPPRGCSTRRTLTTLRRQSPRRRVRARRRTRGRSQPRRVAPSDRLR